MRVFGAVAAAVFAAVCLVSPAFSQETDYSGESVLSDCTSGVVDCAASVDAYLNLFPVSYRDAAVAKLADGFAKRYESGAYSFATSGAGVFDVLNRATSVSELQIGFSRFADEMQAGAGTGATATVVTIKDYTSPYVASLEALLTPKTAEQIATDCQTVPADVCDFEMKLYLQGLSGPEKTKAVAQMTLALMNSYTPGTKNPGLANAVAALSKYADDPAQKTILEGLAQGVKNGDAIDTAAISDQASPN